MIIEKDVMASEAPWPSEGADVFTKDHFSLTLTISTQILFCHIVIKALPRVFVKDGSAPTLLDNKSPTHK